MTIGVLPGSFHPVTRAHVALAHAALAAADRVLFVMPRRFPHKEYEPPGLDARMELVRLAIAGEPRFGALVTEGGLFIDIAREIRVEWPAADLWFLCGRDAAERIVEWPYPDAGIEEQLREYGLLVAARQGEYHPPPRIAGRVRPLAVAAEWDEVSATEVRRRIRAGEPWRTLVPASAADRIEQLYRDAPLIH